LTNEAPQTLGRNCSQGTTQNHARAQEMKFLSVLWPLALAILWGFALTWTQSKIKIPQAIAPLYLIIAVGPAVLAIYYAIFNIPDQLTYENTAWLLTIGFVVSLVFRLIKKYFTSPSVAYEKSKTLKQTHAKRRE
jgi:hypothetical protein